MNEVEKKKIKRLIIISCTILALCLVAIIGTTYAIFSRREEGETQALAFGNFNVTFNQTGNSISLTNAYPMSDSQGQQNEPLSFTIQNNSGTTAKYQLSIQEEEGNTLSASKLRYSLTKNSQAGTPGSLENLILNEPQTLTANGTDTYELRIWIDENAGNEVQGLTWSGRIVVTSVQAQGELEDHVAPVLVLNGESTMNVIQSSTFTDPGIQSITDNQDTNLSISNVQTQIEYFDGSTFTDVTTVDTSKLGVYYIYYSITDSQGNTGRIARSVNVHRENTTPPTITLVGDHPLTWDLGTVYTDPGVTAVDSDNTNISQNVSSIHTLNTNVTGTYIIKYYVADKYGNIGSSTRTVNVEKLWEPEMGTMVVYEDTSGATPPSVVEGLIPVVWDSTNEEWVKADTNAGYYNYDEQIWANAVTVSEQHREAYYNSAPGSIISMDDIETMWVWIPRYSYTIKNDGNGHNMGVQGYGGDVPSYGESISGVEVNTPGAIDIKFIDVDTKETGSAQYTGSTPSEWRTPDGFIFGTQELPGIWVAKFETSSTNPSDEYGGGNDTSLYPLVKPDVISWRNINVSNAFTVSRKLTAEGNRYGLDIAADGHMMKNSEWGVVAYLSQSKYGKYGNTDYTGANKEVYKNDSNSYYTGRSEGSAPPSYGDSSAGSYTYAIEENGTGASTTGTIYGVYDMSGGSQEYTMSNYNGTIGSAGFSSLPDSKYYEKYTSSTASNACNGGVCYGHALSETSGWYSDSAAMVNSNLPWALRGSSYSLSYYAGVFYFGVSDGGNSRSRSFRLVLAPGA